MVGTCESLFHNKRPKAYSYKRDRDRIFLMAPVAPAKPSDR